MSDIIHLLPDSIANQIAAGEVIQRPASVVKELLENSVDAGAKNIRLDVVQAGRDSIRVTDDGKGMSPNDARMAFERHATSKISNVEGLYTLRTMGFRGEALASIAAVAQVELLTRMADDELGTSITLSGSVVSNVQPATSPVGTIMTVKNLFFNVPARRKFLKTNDTEFRHIMEELERVALVNPTVSISVYHNGNPVLELPTGSLKSRILNVLGKKLDKDLLPIQMLSPLGNITGFTGRPDGAKKKGSSQYFFVNGRYMRHPYFHKAVMMAYDQLIPAGTAPNYLIYFEIEPAMIDVNIHPTKTEIKFADEKAIFNLLISTIREALGSSSATPTIDFDRSQVIDMPIYPGRLDELPPSPKTGANPHYNPFSGMDVLGATGIGGRKSQTENIARRKAKIPEMDWSDLLTKFNNDAPCPVVPEPLFPENQPQTSVNKHFVVSSPCFIYKERYIVTALTRGIAMIDFHRAHVRVLYEQFLSDKSLQRIEQQRLLFPEVIEFEQKNVPIAEKVMDEMNVFGFDFSPLGGGSYSILSAPALATNTANLFVQNVVETYIQEGLPTGKQFAELMASHLAEHTAMPYGHPLSPQEADSLLAKLFATAEPNYTPSGKIIISLILQDDIEQRFH